MKLNGLHKAGAALVLCCVLVGCTQERALALKAGAQAFSDKAVAAIDALVELQLRGMLGKTETEEVLIRKAREDLLETQRKAPDQLSAVIDDEAFAWINERSQLRLDGFSKYGELKDAYEAFAAAYRRLPEGSVLAVGAVACSAVLGARLVNRMALAGQGLLKSPVLLRYETLVDTRNLKSAAKEAVQSRNEQPFDAAVRSRVALLKEQGSANAAVVQKLADAAEAGMAVLDMIEKYNDVSIADLLQALRRVLVVRESTAGLSSQAQRARLDDVIAKLNSKPALAGALTLPLNQAPPDCN
jgi:hypothetical protein